MKCRFVVQLAMCMALSLGCTPLPALDTGICGNYVIDSGEEDCDGHAFAPNVCAAPGEKDACHFICDEPGSVCPDGFGCGYDGLCRKTSRVYAPMGDIAGDAWQTSLRTADFDSDGNEDFLLLGEPNSFGQRPAEALFSREFSLSTGLASLPLEIANPALGNVSGDGAARDIAFADIGGIALLRGNGERGADFAIFPTIELPGKMNARALLTDALTQAPGDEAVLLEDRGAGNVSLVGVDNSNSPVVLTSLSGGIAKLAGGRSFFTGGFDEGLPCDQVVLVYRETGELQIFPPCKVTGQQTTWNESGQIAHLTLDPQAAIDRGALSADIDLDGHLDLMIGASGKTYVAYGLGDGRFASVPGGSATSIAVIYELPTVAGTQMDFPLAAADFNVDGQIDFVTPAGIIVSVDSANAAYTYAYEKLGGAWTEATIADLNANGLPDIAACSSDAIDIDFLNNAGSGSFGAATLRTDGHPSKLVAGDVDGDLINDLVFGDLVDKDGQNSEYLSVAFGSSFGPPAPPILMGEAAGTFRAIVMGHVNSRVGVDPMADIGVVEENEAGHVDGVAILPGRASRAVFSLLPLNHGSARFIPVSMAFGLFGDPTSDIVVLGAHETSGELRLFRVEGSDAEESVIPQASAALSSSFRPANTGGLIDLRYGAIVSAADLDNDGTDEAIVVGAFGSSKQAALVVNRYNAGTMDFAPGTEQVFDADITTDSRLLVQDVDGDDALDLLLTTGSMSAPSDLIVFWGNGTTDVSTAADSISRVRPGDTGVRAVACARAPASKAMDLLASTPEGLYRLALSANHKFNQEKLTNIHRGYSLAVVDLDHDGVEDLAMQTEGGLELFRSIPAGE